MLLKDQDNPINKFTNLLIHENSPYLLQHAHNPVHWHSWNEAALKRASLENKLILVSIGYAACHWCHVMEKESFENEEIASLLNENFVCIKVDREQRPDLDLVYMNAIQLITGSGGWPLNCFTLPDGNPVWGGTYFPPDYFKEVLIELSRKWKTQPEIFQKSSDEIKAGMKGYEMISTKEKSSEFSKDLLNSLYLKTSTNFDRQQGGYRQRVKFPMPSDWQFLMNYAFYTQTSSLSEQIDITLTKMAQGGIYDHLRGGFCRYSTDENWKLPHFEKMLYDNAQLVSLYCNAWKLHQNPQYQKIVYDTMQFISREMLSTEYGFFSSIDADSEGIEGKFYTWKQKEIEDVLGLDSELFCNFFNIKQAGNWEKGENILFINDSRDEAAKKAQLNVNEFINKINQLKKKLLEVRQKRIRPATDDKILTAWNALMLKACVDSYKTFHERNWLNLALKNANFIYEKMLNQDFSLFRCYRNGKSEIYGFLDDYAFTAQAFINLYQATFDEKWLNLAKNICDYTIEHFYDSKSGMFFYTSDLQEIVVTRKMEIYDNVIPSSNSVMAQVLFLLGFMYENSNYSEKARQMALNVQELLRNQNAFNSNWLSLLLWYNYPPLEVIICGSSAKNDRSYIDKHFLPNIIIAGCEKESQLPIFKDRFNQLKTLVYICQNKVCDLPNEDIVQVVNKLKAEI